MKKIYLFFAAVLLALTITQPASADKTFLAKYTQTLFNSDNEMGASDAVAVLQTSDGYIWAASYSGLLRYDGTAFERYCDSQGSGFTATSATALYEDTQKRLWVGTNESGLFRRDSGKFVQIKNNAGQAFNAIRSITGNKQGNIYVGSSGGIGILKDDAIEAIKAGELDTAFVLGLCCDPRGRLWGVTRAGEAFVAEDERVSRILKNGDMLGHSALSVICRRSGQIVLGTSEGGIIGAEDMGGCNFKFTFHAAPEIETVNGLYEDSSGRLWACGDKGFGYFDDKYVFHRMEGALMDNSIETIQEDYEHNFWAASSRQGLLQIARNKFMDINFAMSLPTGVVNATCIYRDMLYIGTDEGLYAVDRSWRRAQNKFTKALAGLRVRNVMADSRGNLWASTYKSSGIARLGADGEITFITAKDGLPSDKVRLTLELKNGDIAVGTNGGVAIIRGGKVTKTYTERDGLLNQTILSICEDDNGTVYAGSDGGGIYVIKDGVVANNFTVKDGLPSGVILRMFYDRAGQGIWISTGNTLSFYDFKTIRTIRLRTQINSGIFDIGDNVDGRLMLLADTGIHIADKKDLLADKNPECVSYMRRDGLRSTITANSWNCRDKHGTLYLCCANGTYGIDLNNVFINKAKPKIAINRAEVDGKVYENPTKLVLPSNAKRLTLDIAVLSFVNPGYNSASYELEGFDKEFTTGNAKSLRKISYTNLKGGVYNFIFGAANSDGVENASPITLIIEKQKALSEQPVFLFLCGFTIIALIFLATRGYYHKRNKELIRRQSELREITTQAITAIANTIDAKDKYTKGHSTRVANYSVKIAEKMGFDKDQVDNLYYTALLHDIGKIGVPDQILNKPDRLTDEEFAIMKQHPAIGGEILKNITIISEIKDGAAYHHERYDGTGYNTGLKGGEIPLTARIIGVADAVDAMGSTRPYRTHRTVEYVISELERCSGKQFDPEIARIFINLLKSGEVTLDGDNSEE